MKQRKWPGIDLVDAGLVTTLAIDGLTQPVMKATAPNIKNVDQKLLKPVKGAAIPYRGSSVVLAYDSKNVATRAEDASVRSGVDQVPPRQIHLQLAEQRRLRLLVRRDRGRQLISATF